MMDGREKKSRAMYLLGKIGFELVNVWTSESGNKVYTFTRDDVRAEISDLTLEWHGQVSMYMYWDDIGNIWESGKDFHVSFNTASFFVLR